MSDIIGDFCDETAHISTIFVDYIKVLAPSMLAHGHRLFAFEKQHERGRNAVPFVVKGKRNQLALANQPLRFRMIIKVHSTSFCLSPSSFRGVIITRSRVSVKSHASMLATKSVDFSAML